jgi:hypothetical protein
MSCYGHWIIDNETVHDVNSDGLAVSDKYSQRGYVFMRFNTEIPDKYILSLSVNASKMNNNSVIQCRYLQLSGPNITFIVQSRTARVFVLPSE